MSSVPAHFLLVGSLLPGALLPTVGAATACPTDCSSRGLFTSGAWPIKPDWHTPGICWTGPFPWQSGYCEVAHVRAEPYAATGGPSSSPRLIARFPLRSTRDGLVRHADTAPRRHPAEATTLRESACKQYPNLC
jgi:hypothetical protein